MNSFNIMNQKQNNNRRRRPNNSRNNNKRRRSKRPLSASQVIIRYDTLLDQHLQNRQKLYSLFHRADPQQKAKLERKYAQSLEQLRQFEERLKPWQKEVLEKKTQGYNPDYSFSQMNDIDPTLSEDAGDGPWEDPHELESMKSRPSYAEDKEESKGTMEDYYAYKGIEPPTPEIENQTKQ